MTPGEIESCWKAHNRKFAYYCKEDPRVIVPRRRRWMGWTINFARPSAIPMLLFIVALLVVPAEIATAKGAGTAVIHLTMVVSILVVCLLSAYLSSTKRWSR
jgi:hypothetical protein